MKRADQKKMLIRLVQTVRKKLEITDEAFEGIKYIASKKTSCADMTISELEKVKNRLKEIGWAPEHPRSKKIRQLLDEMGLPDTYVAGIARNMFGIDSIRWCSPEQQQKVLVALLKHKRRKGGSHERTGSGDR